MNEYEDSLKLEGYKIIVGTDEAGRGPLYGPVVCAACYLPEGFYLEGLNDSKKLTDKKRREYYEYLIKNTIYGISIIDHNRIDEINIYEASKEGMLNAVMDINNKVKVDYILTDAMKLNTDIPYLAIIKGDSKSYSIAAASIIAKVTRDNIMLEIDKQYPGYNFKKHKGYPTKEHIAKIYELGLIDGYRKTYSPINKISSK